MASKRIREALRRIVEQEIDEMTGTGGVSGFGTPYAFSTKEPVSSKKKKRVDEAQRAGTIQHHFDGKRWIAISPNGTKKIVVYDRAHAIEFSKTGMIGGNPDWDKQGRTISHNVNEAKYKYTIIHDRDSKKTDSGVINAVSTKDALKKVHKKYPNAYEHDVKLSEGGDPYYAWRNDETATPKMKIGKVISEINKQLREMERVVRRTSRLKKEMGVPNSGLWQRTNNALMKMESRMHRISQTIRNMRG